jgi:hypothetical protein
VLSVIFNCELPGSSTRWVERIAAGSDLFIVYTAGQRFASLVAANSAQFYENRFAIKYTYSWRP